jgi:hypothetical protein
VARKLTDQQMAELEELRHRCALILDFLETRVGVSSAQRFRDSLEETYADRALGDMRILWRDSKEWLKDLSPSQRAEIITILEANTAVDFGGEQKKERDAVQKILQRNRIRTDAEYRLVLDRVERVYMDPTFREEVQRLNRLLADYHVATDEN